MGTRADFYDRAEQMNWLGSLTFDGYETTEQMDAAKDVGQWVTAVVRFLTTRKDVTWPEEGWPWPWPDSSITDCAYAFAGEPARESGDGHWWPINLQYDANDIPTRGPLGPCNFPTFTEATGQHMVERSGLIVISAPENG